MFEGPKSVWQVISRHIRQHYLARNQTSMGIFVLRALRLVLEDAMIRVNDCDFRHTEEKTQSCSYNVTE